MYLKYPSPKKFTLFLNNNPISYNHNLFIKLNLNPFNKELFNPDINLNITYNEYR